MNEEAADRIENVPAIMVTFTHQLDDNRSMCLQTAIASDCDPADLNARLDVLSKASNRQRAIARLPTVRNLLEIRRAAFEQSKESLLSVNTEKDLMYSRWINTWDAAGHKGTFKPSAAQQQEKQKHEAAYAKHHGDVLVLKKEIESLELEIADLERKAAG